jgi:Golgi nucleoside diphosphatase
MTEVDRARKAAGSGIPFTIVVVLAIICCIGLLIWRASFGAQQSTPPQTVRSR